MCLGIVNYVNCIKSIALFFEIFYLTTFHFSLDILVLCLKMKLTNYNRELLCEPVLACV